MVVERVRVRNRWHDLIVFDQDCSLLAFASQVLQVDYKPEQCAWISRLNDDGSPLVVVVFDRFSPFNCEMSIASDGTKRWYSRAFVSTCYRYAFNQMGLRRITVVVEEDNFKSLKMCRQLGHVQEAVLKEWFGDKDGIAMRMTKKECKWL